MHEHDFGIKAEWHFFATSHGKGPCDGLGGTLNQLAAKASLQHPYENQITNPQLLYEWAVTAMPNITFAYISEDQYAAASRFENCTPCSSQL